METFTKLFGRLLIFVYHCFDRVVIHGYLSGLSRPGQVVHFFHDVVGEPVIDKAVLSRRTNEYQGWVEAYARNRGIPIEWAEPKVRKEDYVRPAQRRMKRSAPARGVLHSEEHGAGTDFPLHRSPVSHGGSKLPYPGQATQPLHSLLLL